MSSRPSRSRAVVRYDEASEDDEVIAAAMEEEEEEEEQQVGVCVYVSVCGSECQLTPRCHDPGPVFVWLDVAVGR